jgi:hypothetical protein
MATKGETDVAAAIEALVEAGYEPDGQTRSESVRTGSAASPVLGSSGGRISSFGGRSRFAVPGSPARATVGKVTVALYERGADGKAQNMRALPTRDTAQLREALGLVPAPRP